MDGLLGRGKRDLEVVAAVQHQRGYPHSRRVVRAIEFGDVVEAKPGALQDADLQAWLQRSENHARLRARAHAVERQPRGVDVSARLGD